MLLHCSMETFQKCFNHRDITPFNMRIKKSYFQFCMLTKYSSRHPINQLLVDSFMETRITQSRLNGFIYSNRFFKRVLLDVFISSVTGFLCQSSIAQYTIRYF